MVLFKNPITPQQINILRILNNTPEVPMEVKMVKEIYETTFGHIGNIHEVLAKLFLKRAIRKVMFGNYKYKIEIARQGLMILAEEKIITTSTDMMFSDYRKNKFNLMEDFLTLVDNFKNLTVTVDKRVNHWKNEYDELKREYEALSVARQKLVEQIAIMETALSKQAKRIKVLMNEPEKEENDGSTAGVQKSEGQGGVDS